MSSNQNIRVTYLRLILLTALWKIKLFFYFLFSTIGLRDWMIIVTKIVHHCWYNRECSNKKTFYNRIKLRQKTILNRNIKFLKKMYHSINPNDYKKLVQISPKTELLRTVKIKLFLQILVIHDDQLEKINRFCHHIVFVVPCLILQWFVVVVDFKWREESYEFTLMFICIFICFF